MTSPESLLGDLAARVPTHAVGDQEHLLVFDQREVILVVGALHAHIGLGCVTKSHGGVYPSGPSQRAERPADRARGGRSGPRGRAVRRRTVPRREGARVPGRCPRPRSSPSATDCCLETRSTPTWPFSANACRQPRVRGRPGAFGPRPDPEIVAAVGEVSVDLASFPAASARTSDDLTAEAVALAAGVPLVRDAASRGRHRGHVRRPWAGRCPTSTVNRPICRPAATCCRTRIGTAPGFAVAFAAAPARRLHAWGAARDEEDDDRADRGRGCAGGSRCRTSRGADLPPDRPRRIGRGRRGRADSGGGARPLARARRRLPPLPRRHAAGAADPRGPSRRGRSAGHRGGTAQLRRACSRPPSAARSTASARPSSRCGCWPPVAAGGPHPGHAPSPVPEDRSRRASPPSPGPPTCSQGGVVAYANRGEDGRILGVRRRQSAQAHGGGVRAGGAGDGRGARGGRSGADVAVAITGDRRPRRRHARRSRSAPSISRSPTPRRCMHKRVQYQGRPGAHPAHGGDRGLAEPDRPGGLDEEQYAAEFRTG